MYCALFPHGVPGHHHTLAARLCTLAGCSQLLTACTQVEIVSMQAPRVDRCFLGRVHRHPQEFKIKPSEPGLTSFADHSCTFVISVGPARATSIVQMDRSTKAIAIGVLVLAAALLPSEGERQIRRSACTGCDEQQTNVCQQYSVHETTLSPETPWRCDCITRQT